MNELDLLIRQIMDGGLTESQTIKSFQIISLWINDEYPIMGALVEIWLKEKGLSSNIPEKDNAKG